MALDRRQLQTVAAAQGAKKAAAESAGARFAVIDGGRYRMEGSGCTLEIDYLRREHGQLKGELMVRCDLPGALTFHGGVLAVGDINLSAPRTRQSHAKYLAARAQTGDEVDWTGLLEDFAQRVITAERNGDPSVELGSVEEAPPDSYMRVLGWPLLANGPVILFGDGGTCKSLLALYAAGLIAQRDKAVGYFDWEWDPGIHKKRLRKLFGDDLPVIHYARCVRPLAQEVDRLRRIVREHALDFAVFDSVAYACDGPPEAAEVTMRYFQGVRRCGVPGSLHTAHITKAIEGADKRPFGSSFWHNSARATWNIKLDSGEPGDSVITAGLYHRKANEGGFHRAVGVRVTFGEDETRISQASLAESQTLAANLPVPERLRLLLARGTTSREEINEELADVNAKTLRWALHSGVKKGTILKFPAADGHPERFALAERRKP